MFDFKTKRLEEDNRRLRKDILRATAQLMKDRKRYESQLDYYKKELEMYERRERFDGILISRAEQCRLEELFSTMPSGLDLEETEADSRVVETVND